MIDASGGRLLEGFEKLLGNILVPALKNQKVYYCGNLNTVFDSQDSISSHLTSVINTNLTI